MFVHISEVLGDEKYLDRLLVGTDNHQQKKEENKNYFQTNKRLEDIK